MHARMLFHKDVFQRACLYTEIFSHKNTFTQRSSCTEMLSHTEIVLRWGTLRTDAVTNRGACTKEAFTREAFTYGHFYTDILLHEIRRRTPIPRGRVQQTGAKPEFHHSSWWSRRILCQRVLRAQIKCQFHLCFFSTTATHLLQEDLGKTIQTQTKNLTSPQLWRLKRRGATQNRIFGSFRGSRRISWERVGPAQTHTATSLRHFVREGCVSWTSIHAGLQPSEKIEKNLLKL